MPMQLRQASSRRTLSTHAPIVILGRLFRITFHDPGNDGNSTGSKSSWHSARDHCFLYGAGDRRVRSAERAARIFSRRPELHSLPPQPTLNRKQRRLRAIFQLQFGEDGAHVTFHRAFGEMQLIADLAIAHAAGDQVEHAAFALSQ
jgi:hypothetical protein